MASWIFFTVYYFQSSILWYIVLDAARRWLPTGCTFRNRVFKTNQHILSLPPLTAVSLIKIQKLVPDLEPLKACSLSTSYPAGYYMPNVNNRNTRTMCEISPKLTIKTTERRHSGVFISNFEHISNLVLVFLLSTLSR